MCIIVYSSVAWYIMLRYSRLYHCVLWYVMLCYNTLCYSIICHYSIWYDSFAGFRTGSGQSGFSQKGHSSLHVAMFYFKSAYVATCCYMLPRFVTCCNSLLHVDHIFLGKLIRGNDGTSATTPFVPTPSGSR